MTGRLIIVLTLKLGVLLLFAAASLQGELTFFKEAICTVAEAGDSFRRPQAALLCIVQLERDQRSNTYHHRGEPVGVRREPAPVSQCCHRVVRAFVLIGKSTGKTRCELPSTWALIGQRLETASRSKLRVRVTSVGSTEEASNWSDEFILAHDSGDCGFIRPFPPTRPIRGSYR